MDLTGRQVDPFLSHARGTPGAVLDPYSLCAGNMEKVISLVRNHFQYLASRVQGPESGHTELDESNMKTTDIFLLILAIALIAGMFLTAFFGRGSRHGYGMAPQKQNLSFCMCIKSNL